MTATNHVVTGSVAAALIGQPLVALSVAFLLHFVLDVLPHYGEAGETPTSGYERLKRFLPIDSALAAGVLLTIVLIHPDRWAWICLGGILCASPDLMWVAKFVRYLRGQAEVPLRNWLMRFHDWIQWGERPWGIYVEAAWFLVFGTVLLRLIG